MGAHTYTWIDVLSGLLDIYTLTAGAGGSWNIVKHLISHPGYYVLPSLGFHIVFKCYLPEVLLANKFYLHSHTYYFLSFFLFSLTAFTVDAKVFHHHFP